MKLEELGILLLDDCLNASQKYLEQEILYINLFCLVMSERTIPSLR